MQRLTAFILGALLPAVAPAQSRGPEPPPLAHFTFEAGSIPSEHVRGEEPAGYYALLPKGWADDANKDRKWPWILWLPGFGGPGDFLTRGGAEVLERLRGEGQLPDVALVVFRAPGRRPRTTYMNGEPAGDIEDLITTDLLTSLQQKYHLSDERAHRAVMGVSAGGFGALKIAMRHPELFCAVAVHSAAILPADPEDLAGVAESVVQRQLRGSLAEQLGNPIDKAKWAAQMPIAIAAAKTPKDLQDLWIYTDAGTDDHYGFFEPNQQFDKVLRQHGHRHLFREVEEGGHAWSSPKMAGNVATSLRFVGLALAGKDPVAELAPKPADEKPAPARAGK